MASDLESFRQDITGLPRPVYTDRWKVYLDMVLGPVVPAWVDEMGRGQGFRNEVICNVGDSHNNLELIASLPEWIRLADELFELVEYYEQRYGDD